MKRYAPPAPVKKKGIGKKTAILSVTVLLLAALILSLFLWNARRNVLTVEGQKVSYDMVRHFVKSRLAGASQEELADASARDKLRQEIYATIAKSYATRVVAAEMNVTLSSSQKADLREEVEMAKQLENFDGLMEALYANESVYRELAEMAYYENAVFDALTSNAMGGRFASDNDTIDRDLAAGDWYGAEFVLFTYTEATKEARRAKIQEFRDAVAAGTAFTSAAEPLRKGYGSDFSCLIDGCFTSTIYAEDFEKLVKSLEINELSEVTDSFTSGGSPCFVVVRRIAVTDEYVDQNYDTIIASYLSREYYEYMNERADALKPELTWYYKGMDILDIE